MIIRPAVLADVPAMTALLNEIIALGDTTAHQAPKSQEWVRADYLDGPDALRCFVAEEAGRVIGFQAIGLWEGLPEGWGDIGTFVTTGLQAKGTGAALFAATVQAARKLGLTTINATIRADNVPGLAFYARMGFVDYAHDPDWALEDGRKTGRVSRRFDL